MFLLTRTNLDVPKHRGLTFFLVPTSAPGFELAADPHAVGQAHEHDLLRRRARRRRVARRRRRRRVAGDAGRAVVRARRRRWRPRRRAPARDAPRRHARDAVDDDGRPLHRAGRPRDALARLAIDTEVADLLDQPRRVGGGVGRPAGHRGRGEQAVRRPRRSSGRSTAWSTSPGPPGWCRRTTSPTSSAFYEYCYRFAPVTTIYGGTSEIQRNLVAQRGLGLPRGN